jgi:hypothetical protein
MFNRKQYDMNINKRKKLFAGLMAAVVVTLLIFQPAASLKGSTPEKTNASDPTGKVMLYQQLGLEAMGLSRVAFQYALNGWNTLLKEGKIKKDNILSILDFSLPSGEKRLFVIDLTLGKLLFNTYASHGKNSGTIIPTHFSNRQNSNQSSLGFYITGETYKGKHGTSLRLQGEESGINDNALSRGIVVHGADYANEQIAEQRGYIGRSQGCPAIPQQLSKPIIEQIKNGTCLFIYSPDKNYFKKSAIAAKNL